MSARPVRARMRMPRLALAAIALLVPGIGMAGAADAPSPTGSPAAPARNITGTGKWFPWLNRYCDPKAPPLPPSQMMNWTGACKNGLLDGQGDLDMYQAPTNTHIRISGTFTLGVAQGRETVLFANGDTFEGDFRNGKPNGHGVLTKPSGLVLDGRFEDDTLVGPAVITQPDGTRSDRVFDKDGLLDGPWTSTGLLFRSAGTYRAGLMDGLVVVTYSDGGRIEETVKAGVIGPVVHYTGPSGEHYAGAFVFSVPDPGHADVVQYPDDARRSSQTGIVRVDIAVGANGHVVQTALARSSGTPSLDEAALDGVKAFTYKPSTVDGHPILSTRSVQIPFRIDGKGEGVTDTSNAN